MKARCDRKQARRLSSNYRVTKGGSFRLAKIDPGDMAGYGSGDKPRAKEALQEGIQALVELQDRLYAQDRWALLLIFQAMDAAGKDGAIKHVMSGVNPQGCQVASFKAPSSEELDHDYLWRCHEAPARARPDRHLQPLVLRGGAGRARAPGAPRTRRSCPEELVTKKHLGRALPGHPRLRASTSTRNGVRIVKFFLHVSRDEQKKRFLERIENPEKNWKFSPSDARSGDTGRSTCAPTRT